MTRWSCRFAAMLILLAVAVPRPASAFPTYSRKYATSCSTCHTVYPKLTNFGEAFRRNGFRFPGAFDSDYIKQEIVPMGQEVAKKDFPNSTWPSFITSPPMLGFSATGRATIHPDKDSAAAVKDNHAMVSFDRLGTSASLFAAGNIDDNITFLGIAGISDTATTLDQTLLVWSDVVGPRHLLNLSAGYFVPTITPFGRGSSYTGRLTAASSLGTLYGYAGAPFKVSSKYNIAEANGVLLGRLDYGVGIANGTHDTLRSPGNYYGHVGYKLGGMRFDGEGNSVASDPTKPWAETSATVWGFGYRGSTGYVVKAAAGATPAVTTNDISSSVGGGVRLQLASAELTVGSMWEDHSRITGTLGTDGLPGPATQLASYAEVSYIVYMWLVPALRVEQLKVSPRGFASATATRLQPALDMQLRPNFKLTLVASLEKTSGPPTAGGDWSKLSGDGYNQPKSVTTPVGFQLSVLTVTAGFGF